jgi:hypothetical protein
VSVERYTVCSRGVPIGVTDLGMARVERMSRSGWFHPNAEGERVVAIVGAVLPLLHASVRREVRDGRRAIVLSVEVEGPELSPELAHALQEVAALELTLHRADGSLIPTEGLGIQDVEQLRSIYVEEDDGQLEAHACWHEELDAETRAAIEHDLSALLEDAGVDEHEPWMPAHDYSTEPGRYQVHLRLVSEWDVP